jgi:magnesium-transporting ATPase (P-type)
MTVLNLFMVVFSLQIILLSAYFPARILKRAAFVLQHYPSSTHPKLYPKGSGFFSRNMKYFFWINLFNFIFGWVIMYFIYTGQWVGEKGVHPMLPWGYFMLQMLPSQVMELYGMRLAKLMKQQDSRTIKTARLAPRNIFNYISPRMIVLVSLSFLSFAGTGLYVENPTSITDSKTFLMSGILMVGFLIFYFFSKWLINGKVKDPYQSAEDRHKSVSKVIHTFCYTLVACCLFMLMTLLIETYEMKTVMPIMMSAFLQLLVVISMGYMLNNCRMEDINFDVYKTN